MRQILAVVLALVLVCCTQYARAQAKDLTPAQEARRAQRIRQRAKAKEESEDKDGETLTPAQIRRRAAATADDEEGTGTGTGRRAGTGTGGRGAKADEDTPTAFGGSDEEDPTEYAAVDNVEEGPGAPEEEEAAPASAGAKPTAKPTAATPTTKPAPKPAPKLAPKPAPKPAPKAPAKPKCFDTIGEGLVQNNLTFFSDIITASDFTRFLAPIEAQQTLNVTLFAPSNAALEQLQEQLGIGPLVDFTPGFLQAFPAHHTVVGKGPALTSAELGEEAVQVNTFIPLVNEKECPLESQLTWTGSSLVNALGQEAEVIKADLTSCNGTTVIHVIDTVLVPNCSFAGVVSTEDLLGSAVAPDTASQLALLNEPSEAPQLETDDVLQEASTVEAVAPAPEDQAAAPGTDAEDMAGEPSEAGDKKEKDAKSAGKKDKKSSATGPKAAPSSERDLFDDKAPGEAPEPELAQIPASAFGSPGEAPVPSFAPGTEDDVATPPTADAPAPVPDEELSEKQKCLNLRGTVFDLIKLYNQQDAERFLSLDPQIFNVLGNSSIPITVFLPTKSGSLNSAATKLSTALREAEDLPESLKKGLVAAHIIVGETIDIRDLRRSGTSLRGLTLLDCDNKLCKSYQTKGICKNKLSIKIDADDSDKIAIKSEGSTAKILRTNEYTCNKKGVVHEIDAALIPNCGDVPDEELRKQSQDTEELEPTLSNPFKFDKEGSSQRFVTFFTLYILFTCLIIYL